MSKIAFVSVLLISILALCRLAFADGMIVPVMPGPPGTPQFPREVPMPEIRVHRVETSIQDGIARTEVDQVFYNNHARAIEGMYIFPLPRGASVSGFSMFVDGRRVEGELLGSDEAARIYEEIVRRRLDPAILEYVGTDIFRARVYPFEARSEKRVNIAYDMVLERFGSTYEYLYPLSTEQFSPVPIDEVLIEVSISSKEAISNIFSPTHQVDVSVPDDATYLVTYEESDIAPDIDFTLFFDVPDDDIGFNILPYHQRGEDGFFVALISPRYDLGEEESIPRDVVLILDTSGSMKGDKIDQAREALSFALKDLGEDERFGLVAFSSSVKPLSDRLLPATEENVLVAERFLDDLEAVGGTNIAGALEHGLSLFGASRALKIMVFITDGLPTVGVRDTKGILEQAAGANRLSARIFAFGVGYDVNTHLLDLLSRDNSGLSEYVRPEESVEARVTRFFEKLSLPVLSDTEIDFEGAEVYEVFPKRFSDVFKNTQILVTGRYGGDGGLNLTLSGQRLGRPVTYVFETRVPEHSVERDFVPRLWASQKIGYLLDEIRLSGEDPELVEEIVYLSKRYGIMTPYTSFLVREDAPLAMEDATRRVRESIQVDALKTTGKAAVDYSEASRILSAPGGGANFYRRSLPEEERDLIGARVKYVAGKAFYLRQNRWYDAAYEEGLETVEVMIFSDAYFELLKHCPSLRQQVSLGKYVTIRLGDVAVVFGDSGISQGSDADITRLRGLCKI